MFFLIYLTNYFHAVGVTLGLSDLQNPQLLIMSEVTQTVVRGLILFAKLSALIL